MARQQQAIADIGNISGHVAYNLRRLRAKAGLTVLECSQDTGISLSTWYVLEAGKRDGIRNERISQLADYFEVPPSEFGHKPRAKR